MQQNIDTVTRLMRVEQMDKRLIEQAHRDGWEQAKMEAKLLSFSCSCHKAIASMEYKEEVLSMAFGRMVDNEPRDNRRAPEAYLNTNA